MISKTISTDQNNCGIFGGGGRSGSSIVGRPGRSGSVGISKVGSNGKVGSHIPAVGTSGSESFGRLGNTIGLRFTSSSGMYIVIPALIL